MDIQGLGHKIAAIPGKIKDYAKERPGTNGDDEASSPGSAAMAGTIEGFITGGTPVAVGGGVGGYLGVKAGEEGSIIPTLGRAADAVLDVPSRIIDAFKGEKHEKVHLVEDYTDKLIKPGSFRKAITTGFAAGAIATAGTMTAVMGVAGILASPLGAGILAVGGVLGGLSGVAGTLSGSKRAITRDGVYGGGMTGMITGAATGNPAMMIAGAVAGGIGAKAVKPLGRAIVGFLAGAVTGALTGILGGPVGMAIGAATGAVVGAVGATAGHAARQVISNATDDLASAVKNRIPDSVRKKLGTKSKTALGAVAGALSLATLGLVFAPLVGGIAAGVGIAAGIGALTGATAAYKMVKATEKQADIPDQPVPQWQDPLARAKDQAAAPSPTDLS